MSSVPVLRGALSGGDLDDLQAWTSHIQGWPPGSHRYGHYAERTESGDVVCRTENVSACHEGVAALVQGPLAALVGEALGEDAVDFKDKINYKQPGGAGFGPHQDLRAYPGVERVLSILVAVDPCSTESGCVWLASDVHRVLPTDDRGVLTRDVVATLAWAPAELGPGDAVLLDGLAPHYSESNRSSVQRRVLVASYAPTSHVYDRARYYAARTHAMDDATTRDHRFRISTLADFEGVEVGAPSTQAGYACWHA